MRRRKSLSPMLGLALILVAVISGICFIKIAHSSLLGIGVLAIGCLVGSLMASWGSSARTSIDVLQDINSNLSELKQIEQLKTQREFYRDMTKRAGGE